MATEIIPPQSHQPYISPLSVLERLDPALGLNGTMKSGKEEVAQVVSVMKDSQMLVSKCVILNVIKATTSQPTLTRFMDAGGWPMLNMWLVEAKKTQNTALLVELLKVLQKLPVTVGSLKQGTMGKLIKQLSKQEHPEVKTLAGDLLNSWMAIFREGQSAKSKNGSTSTEPTSEPERKSSTSGEDGKKTDKTNSSTSVPLSLNDSKKDKKSSNKKKSSKKDPGPPIEAQPPPGPLVALGKPRDKAIKRPRDISIQRSQVPPEKKTKASPSTNDTKPSKGLMESQGFMDALSSQVQAERMRSKEKKAKKLNKTTKLTRTNSNGGSEPTPEVKVEPTTPTKAAPTEEAQEQKEEEQMEVPTEAQRLKKRVSWAEDTNLVSVHYFDLDESERVNVNRPKSFLDAAQREKLREREARESGLMFSRDRLIEMIPWIRPPRLDLPSDLVERGTASEQRAIQSTREGKVLAQLFLSKASLPSTPTEPDPEPDVTETEPKLIPLMEPNAPGGSSQPPMFTSPPPAMPPPGGGHRPPESPLQSPGTGLHQPPYFNEGNGNSSSMGQFNHQVGGPNNGPPPPRGPPQNPPFQGGDANFMQFQQGFPPPPGDPQVQWGPQGPPPQGGNFYGDQFFRGRGGPPLRRGRGFGMRGRGRGFASWRGRVCKHYITHGCKLGNSCKFLHCTPEELANKMATNDPPTRNGPKPSFNSHDSPRLKQEFNYPSPSRHRQDSTENKMDISENSSSRKSD